MKTRVLRDGLMELPEPFPPFGDFPRTLTGEPIGTRTEPHFTTMLVIKLDGRVKRFVWDTNSGDGRLPRDPDQWNRLLGFVRFLDRMVRANPAMKTAPAPNGFYQ